MRSDFGFIGVASWVKSVRNRCRFRSGSEQLFRPLLPGELWEVIEPLLPQWTPSPKGDQPPVPNRNVLTDILFVLKTGLPWGDLPCERNCGCERTCWRRAAGLAEGRHLGQGPQGVARQAAG